MSVPTLVFFDDAERAAGPLSAPDSLGVSLDCQATSDLLRRVPTAKVKALSGYSEKPFKDFDELYEHLEASLRERLRPKDGLRQSRFLFNALWSELLLLAAHMEYAESLAREALRRERPRRVEFAISSPEWDLFFRRVTAALL